MLALLAIAVLVNLARADEPALPVTETGPAQAAPIGAEMTAAERELKLRRGTAAALAQRLYPIAHAGADELIRTIEQRAGPDSPELVGPLANLASACLELGDAESADKAARRALTLLGDRRGAVRVSLLLIAGRAAFALTNTRRSEQILEEALSVAKQIEPRDRLAEAQVYEELLNSFTAPGASSLTDARIARGNRYVAALRGLLADIFAHDPGGLGMALPVVADWYLASGDTDRARSVLNSSVKHLEKAYGPRDPRLSLGLRSLASCSFREHLHGTEAIEVLARAAALPNDGSVAGTYEHAEALAMQADAHVTFGRPEVGTDYYSQAWHTLAQNEQIGAVGANRFFDRPVPLYLLLTADIPPGHQDRRILTLVMTITATGLVERPQFVSDDGRADPGLLSAIRISSTRWRYRPRVVDGSPVEATGHRAEWNFKGANWVPLNQFGPGPNERLSMRIPPDLD